MFRIKFRLESRRFAKRGDKRVGGRMKIILTTKKKKISTLVAAFNFAPASVDTKMIIRSHDFGVRSCVVGYIEVDEKRKKKNEKERTMYLLPSTDTTQLFCLCFSSPEGVRK